MEWSESLYPEIDDTAIEDLLRNRPDILSKRLDVELKGRPSVDYSVADFTKDPRSVITALKKIPIRIQFAAMPLIIRLDHVFEQSGRIPDPLIAEMTKTQDLYFMRSGFYVTPLSDRYKIKKVAYQIEFVGGGKDTDAVAYDYFPDTTIREYSKLDVKIDAGGNLAGKFGLSTGLSFLKLPAEMTALLTGVSLPNVKAEAAAEIGIAANANLLFVFNKTWHVTEIQAGTRDSNVVEWYLQKSTDFIGATTVYIVLKVKRGLTHIRPIQSLNAEVSMPLFGEKLVSTSGIVYPRRRMQLPRKQAE